VSRVIAIMAKAPIPGQAKTRLAAAIGDEAAARLHRAFLEQSVATACSVPHTTVALMAPDSVHAAALHAIVPPGVAVWHQQRPGLMAGISQAFEHAQAGGADTVLVSETDSATLPAAHLAACFELLAQPGSLVLGPCADGGYYLAGASNLDGALARDLFEGETYSSETICQSTAIRARILGLDVMFGPEWYDVDTLDDLRRLSRQLEQLPPGEFDRLRRALVHVPLAEEEPV